MILSPDEVGGGEYMRYSPGTDRVADDERAALTAGVESRNLDWLELTSRDGLTFRLDAMASLDEAGEIRLPVFNYKGIAARDSEENLLPVSDGLNCRAVVTVPAGFDGPVTVGFEEPLPWRVASWISLLSLAAFLAAAVLLRKHGG